MALKKFKVGTFPPIRGSRSKMPLCYTRWYNPAGDVLWGDYEALVDRIEKAIAASDCSACNAFLASLLSGRD